MGQAACRCHCDCERQCSRLISGTLFITCMGGCFWTSLPYAWGNPFYERGREGPTCSEVSWAASYPGIVGAFGLGWFITFQIAREWAVFPMLCGSFLALCGLVVCSIALLILVATGSCEDALDVEFVNSMCLMVIVPFSLFSCCVCASTGCPCCCCQESEDHQGGAGARRNGAGGQPPRKRPRVRRAQRILREALILGDGSIADLLLDYRQRRCRALWRMYRCIFLSFVHCQFRCSCCAGVPEDEPGSPNSPHTPSERGHATPTSRASASRASLFFSYEDEDHGELPIHYLARGEHFVQEGRAAAAAAEAAQRCFVWSQRDRRLWKLPELTDERRARLLHDLAASGRLPLGQLHVVNATAQTPLHCAASSGSFAVAQELLLLGEHVDPIGVSISADDAEQARSSALVMEDVNGDSPCEVALKSGHVVCARLLAGDYGLWQGLLKLPHQRHALRECLSGALGRMSAEAPTSKVSFEKHAVHHGAGQLLSVLDQQIRELQNLCGLVVSDRMGTQSPQLLPKDAAEALLQCHKFDVEAAVAAFRASPREALDAAGLKSVDFHPAGQIREQPAGGIERAASNLCIVCFDEVDPAQSACRLLLCKHRTCDTCLSMHVKVRLDEGDVTGVVCPEPNCRLPISEEILLQIFGPGSQEQTRFEQLKTLKFVDMNKNMAWCPAPGCGRAVSVPSTSAQDGQGSKLVAGTAVCGCGTQFCFNCKSLGGHEPVPCQPYQDFLQTLALVRKQMEDETNKWLSQNSKTCSCGASIQRNGGCNHMICSVCGRHFCYICGQDWAPHRAQPGGFDYYQCRLPTDGSVQENAKNANAHNAHNAHAPAAGATAQDAMMWRLQRECLPGWTANERQPERMKLLFRALLLLAEEFDLGISIQEPRQENDAEFVSARSCESRGCRQAAWEALHACIQARKCLQNCYALKFHWPPQSWRKSCLQTWVPELEGIVGALESALGLTILETQAVKAGFPATGASGNGNAPKLPKQPKDVLRLFDLRQLLPQAIAISETMGALRQLGTAVSLQTARILHSGRKGFPEIGLVEDTWNIYFAGGIAPEAAPSRSRSERCAVM